MLIPRVIPILTIDNNYLVKTKKYKNPCYVGDPFNALRIFNEKEVFYILLFFQGDAYLYSLGIYMSLL